MESLPSRKNAAEEVSGCLRLMCDEVSTATRKKEGGREEGKGGRKRAQRRGPSGLESWAKYPKAKSRGASELPKGADGRQCPERTDLACWTRAPEKQDNIDYE